MCIFRGIFFGHGAHSTDAGGLFRSYQGNWSVSDFSIDLRTKARLSSWNEGALCDAFLHGLSDYIKVELVSHALPSSLDDDITLATNIDCHIQTRQRERPPTLTTRFSAPLPMKPCPGVDPSRSLCITLVQHRGTHAGGPHKSVP